MGLFDTIQLAPADPILGLTEAFKADGRANKVNLGVGVYLDEQGRLPLMKAVSEAEERLAAESASRGYLPIPGLASYQQAVQRLVFGAESAAVADGRVVTAQTLGGTGALKVGADFLRLRSPGSKVLVSDPSWENHAALFTRAGYEVGTYRYYTPGGVDFDGLIADLQAAEPGTVVVLHACCHNPTGYDLDDQQWDRTIEVVSQRGLVAFLDMAYQGFARGLESDGRAVRRFAESGLEFLCSTSFSKTFGLYGERIGSLNIVTSDADAAARVMSQVKIVIRTNYSNPPTHGAALVSMVLGSQELRPVWDDELASMRDRIKGLRVSLVRELQGHQITDMDFIADQQGMFSYSGLNPGQMEQLRDEFGIYGTRAGRMCVAALNADNIGYVASSIASVR
ncbi:MAG: amino acid aminotransferase [Arachnia sp.]